MSRSTTKIIIVLVIIGSLLGVSYFLQQRALEEDQKRVKASEIDPAPVTDDDKFKHIETLVSSEELILELTPALKSMVKLLTLPLPDKDNQRKDGISITDLAEMDTGNKIKPPPSNPLSWKVEWPIMSQTKPSFDPEFVWEAFRKQFQISDPQIGTLRGTFNSETEFVMETKFEGHFEQASDPLMAGGIKAKQNVTWKKIDGEWSLAKWEQKSFSIKLANQALFEDVTADVFPDPETFKRINTSIHRDYLLKAVQAKTSDHPNPKFKEFPDWKAGHQYPSAAVVDIDNDGWDDLFLVDRWDNVMLLRNQQDNTFVDVTDSSGLNVQGYVNCSLFFDFDNDGDQDLFLGRSLYGSQLLENMGGQFRAVEETNSELDDYRFVTCASVADINRDGRLDLYLSTYTFGSGHPNGWIDRFIRKEDRAMFANRILDKNMYLNRGGPANLVLMNHGSALKVADTNDSLKQWRSSYQGAWCDFDDDGDSDLYLCNDFSEDALLRNDTEQGSFDVIFTDVMDEVMPKGNLAFGMGVSWGDYNADGLMDIYVSNMYSKAGLRIIPQVGKTDERILPAAQGNFLYKNTGGRFEQVAGHDPASQQVSIVGWSYGGQFADFNNDGKLDLYVPSGHFSAPPEVSSQEDL